MKAKKTQKGIWDLQLKSCSSRPATDIKNDVWIFRIEF